MCKGAMALCIVAVACSSDGTSCELVMNLQFAQKRTCEIWFSGYQQSDVMQRTAER